MDLILDEVVLNFEEEKRLDKFLNHFNLEKKWIEEFLELWTNKLWLTQKLPAVLFEVEVNTINYHIKEIYKFQEQHETATIRKFRIVQTEGKRQVERDVEFYN